MSDRAGDPERASDWMAQSARGDGRSRLEQPGGFPDQLLGAITDEVLPRMLSAHRPSPTGKPGHDALGLHEIAELTDLSMRLDASAALDYVDGLRTAGHRVEALCLDLLAPAARRLGWLWDHDYCSFIDVTLGLGRLQRVMIRLAEEPLKPVHAGTRHRILIAACTGEQHTLGAQIVAECFRRDGCWDVWTQVPRNRRELNQLMQRQWLDAIGFSASSGQSLESLQADIGCVRLASRNADLIVMVGGPVFAEHPDWVHRVGADLTARDGKDAPVQLRHRLQQARHAGT